MSFKHSWSIAALSSSIDQGTNALSLFDIWEEIQVDAYNKDAEKLEKPLTIHRPFRLVSLWRRINKGDNKIHCKIEFEAPDKESAPVFTGVLEAKESANQHRHVLMFPGLQVKESGQYLFKIFQKENEESEYIQVGATPINVTVNKILKNEESL